MRCGVLAVVAALTLAFVDMAAAQTIMWCHDASGKPVMTNRAGAAGLNCPTEEGQGKRPAVDSTGQTPDLYVSPRCKKDLLLAGQLAKEAWRDFGDKKEIGSYMSAECVAEVDAAVERFKNQRRGK